MASHPNRSSLSRAEAEFINLIEESRWKAAFPPGYPNGFIPPIEVKDTGTGEVIFLLSDDDWLDKWRQYMARTDRSPWPGGADVDATKAPDMSLEPTTPRTPLSATVRKLCRGVSSSRPEPVFLPFVDVGAGYVTRQCHLNVVHRVQEHGGRRVNGWIVWESSLFAELEFHCVWKSPSGELVDVTPRVDGEPVILFMSDRITRLRRSKHGGIEMPANRLSTGHYTVGGFPYPTAFAEIALADSAIQHSARLGIDPFSVCDLP